MTSDEYESSYPSSSTETIARAESSERELDLELDPELDPELEELCRARSREVAAAAIVRLLGPLLLIALLVTIGAWMYIKYATTRNAIRAQTQGDPARAMEWFMRASGKDADPDNLFSKGLQFEPVEFDSRAIQVPTFKNDKKGR